MCNFCEEIKEIEKGFSSINPDFRGEKIRTSIVRLNKLWENNELKEIFKRIDYVYPASHGERHVKNIINILIQLILGIKKYGPVNNRYWNILFDKFNSPEKISELFAAAIIHDIGMAGMERTFTPEETDEIRDEHSKHAIISELSRSCLISAGFSNDECNFIIDIAHAHAADDEYSKKKKVTTVGEKIKELAGRYSGPDNLRGSHVVLAAALLGFSDYLDVGQDRLNKTALSGKWPENQMPHFKKHILFHLTINPDNKTIYLTKYNEPLEVFHGRNGKIWEELRKQVEELLKNPEDMWREFLEQYLDAEESLVKFNKVYTPDIYTQDKSYEWKLFPIDKMLVSAIFPAPTVKRVYNKTFNLAYEDYNQINSTNPYTQERPSFEVDIMGHSQYGLFVKPSNVELRDLLERRLKEVKSIKPSNVELRDLLERRLKEVKSIKPSNVELRDLLQGRLKKGKLKLRLLLLEPSGEMQQPCEVFEAQIRDKDEGIRRIFPIYDKKWQMPCIPIDKKDEYNKRGDIHNTLNELKKWNQYVLNGSSLEVRLTSRILYASLNRFGDRMVISPYTSRGLYMRSATFICEKDSPVFECYMNEFEKIWEDSSETRVYHFLSKEFWQCKAEKSIPNPIKRLIDQSELTDTDSPFAYERFIMDKEEHRKRIYQWFGSPAEPILPPVEIEIHPNSGCNLGCIFCIGKEFPKSKPCYLSSDVLKSIYEYSVELDNKVYRVNRVRISGLTGEPFYNENPNDIDNTKEIIEQALGTGDQKRSVVVFTNGVEIGDYKIIDLLSKVSYVHISLDAGTRETFNLVKGQDKFGGVEDNLEKLAKLIREKNKEIKEVKGNGQKCAKLGIGYVVTQQNAEEKDIKGVFVLAERLRLYNCDVFLRFKPDIRDRGISIRTWKEIEEQIEKISGGYKYLPVSITNISRHQTRQYPFKKCWAQYFSVAVGPDGSVYPCDHHTDGITFNPFGNLKDKTFREIWEKAFNSKNLGKWCSGCRLCSPFNYRINRFLDQLKVYYDSCQDSCSPSESISSFERWIQGALEPGMAPNLNGKTELPEF